MFKDIVTRLFTYKVPDKYKAEYIYSLRSSNARRLLMFAVFSIFLNLAQLFFRIGFENGTDFIFPASNSNLNWVIFVKLLILILFSIATTIMFAKHMQPSDLMGLLNYYVVVLYIFIQLMLVRNDMLHEAPIYTFAYGALLIGVIPIFDMIESVTVTGAYMLIMLFQLFHNISGSVVRYNTFENVYFVIAFSAAAFASSRMMYVSFARNFVSERQAHESKVAMARVVDRLEILSVTDQLTQIYNRRGYEQMLEIYWKKCMDKEKQIAIMMIDIDKFKQYNDYYGHPAGDKCLQAVAGALKDSFMRKADLIGRYGGEEFIAAIPFCDYQKAFRQADRLRRQVYELNLPHQYSDVDTNVTISIGVAVMIPKPGDSSTELINKADAALFRAKRTGRNRVVMYDPVVDGAKSS